MVTYAVKRYAKATHQQQLRDTLADILLDGVALARLLRPRAARDGVRRAPRGGDGEAPGSPARGALLLRGGRPQDARLRVPAARRRAAGAARSGRREHERDACERKRLDAVDGSANGGGSDGHVRVFRADVGSRSRRLVARERSRLRRRQTIGARRA